MVLPLQGPSPLSLAHEMSSSGTGKTPPTKGLARAGRKGGRRSRDRGRKEGEKGSGEGLLKLLVRVAHRTPSHTYLAKARSPGMSELGRAGIQNPVPGGEADENSGACHSPSPECPPLSQGKIWFSLVLKFNLGIAGAQPGRFHRGQLVTCAQVGKRGCQSRGPRCPPVGDSFSPEIRRRSRPRGNTLRVSGNGLKAKG